MGKRELRQSMLDYIDELEEELETLRNAPPEQDEMSTDARELRKQVKALVDIKRSQNVRMDELGRELADCKHERDSALKHKVRADQAEEALRKRHTNTEAKICAALGKFEGDWLQEAVDRLALKRLIGPMDLAVRLSNALTIHGTDHVKVAKDIAGYLGVNLQGG